MGTEYSREANGIRAENKMLPKRVTVLIKRNEIANSMTVHMTLQLAHN